VVEIYTVDSVYLSNEFLFFEIHSLINQTACTIKFNNAR
jgi:hypothetical protein